MQSLHCYICRAIYFGLLISGKVHKFAVFPVLNCSYYRWVANVDGLSRIAINVSGYKFRLVGVTPIFLCRIF